VTASFFDEGDIRVAPYIPQLNLSRLLAFEDGGVSLFVIPSAPYLE
jgi:hypothetical protein